ncbi:WRKY DNA-binding protein 55 [Rhynchospora pubera]|uniref:WRKY DNA-binding protein 55 n=1 Tax=Rhynchospora pubera TaxID=906938 RepID=A0AAV8DJJ2_9POAL|nr:WRKY DNA-binding protein 55 [Rhynchospora pubera]
MVIEELEKTCNLTTLLQQEISSILENSRSSKVALMFEELLRALKLSLNLLSNGEANINNRIHGSTKRRRVEDYQEQEETDNRNVYKEVHTPKPHDDGYLWRKYGRKKILNNMFPRDYYRCTYSSDSNCKAKKYIQLHCNGDPPLYKVIYIHNHTCNTNMASSQKMQCFPAEEIPQPPISLSLHGVRHEEEQEAFLSCLKEVIGGIGTDQQMECSPRPYGFGNVVSLPVESSSIGSAASYQPLETDDMVFFETDDMVTMDLFWPELPEMDML